MPVTSDEQIPVQVGQSVFAYSAEPEHPGMAHFGVVAEILGNEQFVLINTADRPRLCMNAFGRWEISALTDRQYARYRTIQESACAQKYRGLWSFSEGLCAKVLSPADLAGKKGKVCGIGCMGTIGLIFSEREEGRDFADSEYYYPVDLQIVNQEQ